MSTSFDTRLIPSHPGCACLAVFALLASACSSEPDVNSSETSSGGAAGNPDGSGGDPAESTGGQGTTPTELVADVYQTSQRGDNMKRLGSYASGDVAPTNHGTSSGQILVTIDPSQTRQTIYGFGASFTESSAWNLATIPKEKRAQVMAALFNPDEGAGFSLTRTHMNSSDYSLMHYSYVEDDDEDLSTFSINEDLKGFSGDENEQVAGIKLEDPSYDLVPMIKEALAVPGADFKIVASPWSPPSWMKQGETDTMINGSLQTKYRQIWAEYFSKYLSAYKEQGIDIWALTPQNEPLHASDAHWDSNGWTGTAARDFIRDFLGPQLQADGHLDTADLTTGVRLLAYDHNKSVMNDYVAPTYADPEASKYVWGTAFHWYTNSELKENNYYEAELQQLFASYPEKARLHTESSIDIQKDAPIAQYWGLSTDYAGKFVPFTTYAYDIITDLNNYTQGYIEWCVILSNEGKPNPYDNFNSAPVLINPETDEVIYTPLYFLLTHFSKFIRPGAKHIALTSDTTPDGVIYTAAQNEDGSLAIVAFNDTDEIYDLHFALGDESYATQIDAHAMQTLHLRAN